MIIEKEKYVIATKSFPLEFDDGKGNSVSDFENAYLGNYEDTKSILKSFDEADEYQILKVKVMYEF